MGELRMVALTVKELTEALAICGQSRDMVFATVRRLLSRGFLEQLSADDPHRSGTSFEKIRNELATAETELDAISREIETDQTVDRRMVGASLRQAVSRVVVARRFLESLSGQV